MKNVTRGENYMKIDEVYCFISSDSRGEGVISKSIVIDGREMMMPFVCADKARVDSLRKLAIDIGKAEGIKIKLIKLTGREDIEDIC